MAQGDRLFSLTQHFGKVIFQRTMRKLALAPQCTRAIIVPLWALCLSALPAHAGMTVYGLNDIYKLRTEEISFFAVVFVLSTLLLKFLWNVVARDLPALPRMKMRHAAIVGRHDFKQCFVYVTGLEA